jgi:serine/threonine-protein kinase RIM15
MAGKAENQTFLAPPVLAAIRNEDIAARVKMERTVSQEIREERADLKEAAEHSLIVIVDVGLDGKVRWVSPSWKDVVGTPVESIQGKPIAEVILDEPEKDPFMAAIETMKVDDSKSQNIRFRVRLGPSSDLSHDSNLLAAQREAQGFRQDESQEGEEVQIVTLEGQGIMVYDRSSELESHVSLFGILRV